MVRRIGSFVALLLVATLVLAACGSEDDDIEPTVTRIAVEGAPVIDEAEDEEEEAPAEGEAEEELAEGEVAEEPAVEGEAGEEDAAGAFTIDVEMVDIAFTQEEITVPANTEITVNLLNSGVSTHNFYIDELGVQSEDYAGGQEGTLTFNSGEPGEYEFYCAIPGHREAGMVGTLIVTAEGGDAAAAETETDEAAATETEAGADEVELVAASPEASPVALASPVASPAATDDEAAPAAETSYDIEMVDIAFTQKELVVPANTEITVNLVNNGVATHNFYIDELDVKSEDYAGGQEGTITFNTGAPGEYQYYCAIPGHREAGMVGTLIVQ